MNATSSSPHSDSRGMPTHEEFLALVGRAVEGGAADVMELRQVLDRHEELRQFLGELLELFVTHLLSMLAGESGGIRLAMERDIAQTRERLLADGDSVIERFLVYRITVSRLEASIRHRYAVFATSADDRLNRDQLLDRANRRQVECLQALHDFRRS